VTEVIHVAVLGRANLSCAGLSAAFDDE